MNRSLLLALIVTISILAFASIAAAPAAYAKQPPGKGKEKENPGATIDLLQLSGAAAKWRMSPDHNGLVDVVTYRIVDVAGTGVADNVVAAINEWNTVQKGVPYTLVKAASGEEEDILIEMYFKIIPGFIIGFASITGDGHAGHTISAYIALGVKGLTGKGLQNVAAHEIGQVLGDGHADKKSDLMHGSFDQKGRKQITCPSNLDVGALTAENTPEGDTTFTVNNWQQLDCSP